MVITCWEEFCVFAGIGFVWSTLVRIHLMSSLARDGYHMLRCILCIRWHGLSFVNTRWDTFCVHASIGWLWSTRWDARTQLASQHVLSKYDQTHPMLAKDTKCISPCVDQTYHASKNRKSISTSVEQTPPMSARTQNLFQHRWTKPIQCQRRLKMPLIMCCSYPLHASQDTKCISTSVEQTTTKAARTENASQHVLTKPIQCPRGHKMHLNLCWPIPTMPAR